MKLNFGVVDIPYVLKLTPEEERDLKKKRKNKPTKAHAATVTTGDVAEFLEARYHVFETFYKLNTKEVHNALEDRVMGALETALMGGPHKPPADIFADLSPIEELFRRAIDERKFDRLIKGVPTQASLDGVNHRLKNPYALGNPVRPSFFDTGTYSKAAKIWVEE